MIRKTKIIATIGPSSSSKAILMKMISRGVNVCRLNFSHLSHEKAKEIITRIKEINQEVHVHTAILADLQGPKIRVGNFENPVTLRKASEVSFSTNKKDKKAIFINYSSFAKDVKKGDRILLDDGKIALKTIHSNSKNTIKAKVIFGGKLYSNKGVNLPDTQISLPCLTQKDKKDLAFILGEKIEWIGLSFVRSSEDIIKLKKIIRKNKTSNARVIAKIEKPEAIADIDNIITQADAVMVARGDLGVEIPLHKVPVYQKLIVEKCIAQSKPVVIATQMLESMTENISATRAEVNDVANSVIDGADAMMLSAETSVGKHPTKVIDTMRKIIRDVEGSEHNISKKEATKTSSKNERVLSSAICSSACQIAEQTKAQAIITITYSGYNTIKTSSYRPTAFIYAFTNNHSILNTLSLVWGVQGFYYDRGTTTDQTIKETKEILIKNKLIKKGDLVINVASMPANEKGMTNMMKISRA
ncbi:MAG TPA: pyruvate kinase [Flavobacteriales bacterium]|nr:pyruvate kinase [Flavobacteriales bacterium]HIK62932.1 pyruvate kinase [Flavobacteriales bacterium]